MGLLGGISLRFASELVRPLKPAERLMALDALTLCDPFGVAVVPKAIEAVATKLGWPYERGVLQIPTWPLKPPNPNVRQHWIIELGNRLKGVEPDVVARLVRQYAVMWGESGERAVSIARSAGALPESALTVVARGSTVSAAREVVSTPIFDLVPSNGEEVPSGRRGMVLAARNFPLPEGARLVHGVKGDYYVMRGRVVYPPEFERFWSVYPRPVEKQEAYGVWLAIDPSPAEVEDIIAGAQRFADNPYTHANARRMVVYPARWLQRGRWHDAETPIPFRTEEEISEHLELRRGAGSRLRSEDFED
jgi:hypothetical protein